MKIVFLTFNYYPDIGACAFRSISLVEALSKKMAINDEIHIITTHPHRYSSYSSKAKDQEKEKKVKIYRIKVPSFKNGILSQIFKFIVFSFKSFFLCYRIKPDFIIGTTSRLMTGILTWIYSILLNCSYFVDLRDIFSETISDLLYSKNILAARFTKKLFLSFEKRVFQSSDGVSIASEAFLSYFKIHGVNVSNWIFSPNGIDEEFLNLEPKPSYRNFNKKVVVYAGNIGGGQGLEIIIPELAKILNRKYIFKIIGDGAKRQILEAKIKKLGIKNVQLIPPVSRKDLLEFYNKADILFLHLNNIPAFERVLPSKIFEYIALGKPVVGGLKGYSAKFVKDNISHFRLFKPGDIEGCLSSFESLENVVINSSEIKFFRKKFNRKKIMCNLADHILNTFKS